VLERQPLVPPESADETETAIPQFDSLMNRLGDRRFCIGHHSRNAERRIHPLIKRNNFQPFEVPAIKRGEERAAFIQNRPANPAIQQAIAKIQMRSRKRKDLDPVAQAFSLTADDVQERRSSENPAGPRFRRKRANHLEISPVAP